MSNMPEKEATRPSRDPGRKLISFQRTPVMSTYLLAWAFGDFEYVEGMRTSCLPLVDDPPFYQCGRSDALLAYEH